MTVSAMPATVSARPAVGLLRPGCPVPAAEVGGKGAALDRLAQLRFRIPATAIVTASAYRAVAADPTVADLIKRLQRGADVPADVVDTAFLAVPIPDAMAEAVVAAARSVGAGGPVAVRSSATAEDLAAASFAGQYRTSLDVAGDAAVIRAVRLTWASLWHPAPRAYRRSWGIGDNDIAMAVLIMRMVPARMAGVAFSVDPGGAAGSVRVEAVPELGEALVSGDRTPDVWLVPREGGPGAAVPPLIAEAAELALAVERASGTPQDIEWAWDGQLLWLLQARPITAPAGKRGDDCETPVDGSELTTNGIGEMLPGVLAPLVWDVTSFLVEEAFRNTLGELHALPPDRSRTHEFVRRVHGRAALDLDLVRAAARLLPGGSEAEIERQYFGTAGVDPPQAPPAAPPARWRALRHGLRAAAARRRAMFEADVLLAATEKIVAAPPSLLRWDDSELLAYRRRLVAVGARVMTVELAVAAAAAAAYRQLEGFLAAHLDSREAASVTQRVTSGAGLAPRGRPAMSRSIFAGPTWEESGTGWPAQHPATSDRAEACRQLEHRLCRDPRWRRTRILTGQLVDVRLHLLRRLISDATTGLAMREQVKSAVLELGGEVRRVHLELGRRLAARGALDDPGDVDLLREVELAGALDGAGPPPAELASRRRWLRRWRQEPPLPVRFTGSPERPPTAVPVADRLTGWAASPGRYTGPARVVTDPVAGRFEVGEVLVASATDAGWSPLFVKAGAIVVERGGPLSHAAIVARELGVPAVLNIAGATGVLDGRLVTVDGDAGTVMLHSEQELPP